MSDTRDEHDENEEMRDEYEWRLLATAHIDAALVGLGTVRQIIPAREIQDVLLDLRNFCRPVNIPFPLLLEDAADIYYPPS